MASTLSVSGISVATIEWYVGLTVHTTIKVTCNDFAWERCDNCFAMLRWGIAKEGYADCEVTPNGFIEFGSEYVAVGCGVEDVLPKLHTVTQDDIDAIESGCTHYVAFISQGMSGACTQGAEIRSVSLPCPTPFIDAIDFSPASPKTGEEVSFWRTGDGGGEGYYIASRDWNFGDGSAHVTTSGAKHTYDTAGDYTVVYTVTNDCGKSTSKSKAITVAAAQAKHGIEIQLAQALNGKELIAHKAVKVAPGVYWTGPAANHIHNMGRCTWNNINSSKKYNVLVGDACQEREAIDGVVPEHPNMCYGDFDDGDKLIIIVRNPGFDWRLYSEDDVVTISESSFNVVSLSNVEDDLVSDAVFNQVCGWLNIPSGSECDAFWAELYDPVFVANYISIKSTGVDTLGNSRQLTWIDDIGFVFALLGMGFPMIPVGKIATKGMYAVVKLSDKVFSPNVANWTITAMFNAPKGLLHKVGEKIAFSRAIAQVDVTSASEIIDLLDDGFTGDAHLKLQACLDAIDPDDLTTLPSGIDWKELNAALKDKISDPATYREYVIGFGIADGYADSAVTSASRATPSNADKIVIADVIKEPVILEAAGKNVKGACSTLNSIADPATQHRMVKQVENIAKNMPPAFDDISKASIRDVNGYVIKHDLIENVLGKNTCSANWEISTRLFKRLFDGVDEAALAAAECDGLMNLAKNDPVSIAKAVDDYTTRTDKERLLLSLGKSGTAGEQAAAWVSAAKVNEGIDGVYTQYGTDIYDVMNAPSQIGMYAPGGTYRGVAIDAIAEAATKVPSFANVAEMGKMIEEIASTVRVSAISDNAARIAQDAINNDPTSIARTMQAQGVDVITSNRVASEFVDIQKIIDEVGTSPIASADITKITDRMVEADVVAQSNVIQKVIERVANDGTITDAELKSLFNIANHNPVEMAMAMDRIPATPIASFENVLLSKGNKGKQLKATINTRNYIRTKLAAEYGSAPTDDMISTWSRTVPMGLRQSRASGGSFGAGLSKSFSIHNDLLEWAGKHWRAIVVAMSIVGAAKFAMYAMVFEWQPLHAALRMLDVMDQRVNDKYTSVMYAAGNDMGDLDWNVDKESVRDSVYTDVGILCELKDYADKNPIPATKLAQLQELFTFYIGTSAGIVGNSLQTDIENDLEQLLKKYNEQYKECATCPAGAECITGAMAYDARENSDDRLSSAVAYQTIIDASWKCIPTGPADTGSILCKVRSSMGYGAKVTDAYGVQLGTINDASGFKITDLTLGVANTIKIVKTGNYTECTKTITPTASSPNKTFICYIKCTDWVDSVTISMTPSSGSVVGAFVEFKGTAVSAQPITRWLWDFGDAHCPTADNTSTLQNPSHQYETQGVFQVTLTATNECGNSKSGNTEAWVGEGTCTLPVPTITSMATGETGESLTFLGSATTESSISHWTWDFGDGEDAHTKNATHVFTDAGTYTVRLSVSDDCGTSPAERPITITESGVETATVYIGMPKDLSAYDTPDLHWNTFPEIYVDNQYKRKAPGSVLFGGYGPPSLGTHRVSVRADGYQEVSKSFTLAAGDSESWYPGMYPDGYVQPPEPPTGCIQSKTASSLTVKIDAVADATQYMVRCSGYFTDVGAQTVKDLFTSSTTPTIYNLKTSSGYQVSLAVKVAGEWSVVSSTIGNCSAAGTFEIGFCLPISTASSPTTLTVTKTTAVSRITTGIQSFSDRMRRIGGR